MQSIIFLYPWQVRQVLLNSMLSVKLKLLVMQLLMSLKLWEQFLLLIYL
uniref:Uncharacterized protein n=2 Tax=unclassified Caudoviricetes TaxID=2788787 RepID=A0A8S5PJH1_9CAUD|nr:MAG TPA: hypothetical protein [Siphoviridae sp. ctJcm18]DAE06619.1 MAG TPA: hypothetical protein [Siphoviridae sp. ctUGQ45]